MKVFVSFYEMIAERHMVRGVLSRFRDTHVLRAIMDIEGILHAILILRVYINSNSTCVSLIICMCVGLVCEVLNKKTEQNADKIYRASRYLADLITDGKCNSLINFSSPQRIS